MLSRNKKNKNPPEWNRGVDKILFISQISHLFVAIEGPWVGLLYVQGEESFQNWLNPRQCWDHAKEERIHRHYDLDFFLLMKLIAAWETATVDIYVRPDSVRYSGDDNASRILLIIEPVGWFAAFEIGFKALIQRGLLALGRYAIRDFQGHAVSSAVLSPRILYAAIATPSFSFLLVRSMRAKDVSLIETAQVAGLNSLIQILYGDVAWSLFFFPQEGRKKDFSWVGWIVSIHRDSARFSSGNQQIRREVVN